jgi:hypothetical protein
MHRGPVVGVSANATCDTERACDDAEKALRTAEAWAPR